MSITATELKQNLGKYLTLSEKENIYITQYGKVIAVLANPRLTQLEELKDLKGYFKGVSEEEIDTNKWNRLATKCGL